MVGPLPKEDYLRAVRSFGFADAFSDRDDGIFGQAVDPVTPDCVWFMSRFQVRLGLVLDRVWDKD